MNDKSFFEFCPYCGYKTYQKIVVVHHNKEMVCLSCGIFQVDWQ